MALRPASSCLVCQNRTENRCLWALSPLEPADPLRPLTRDLLPASPTAQTQYCASRQPSAARSRPLARWERDRAALATSPSRWPRSWVGGQFPTPTLRPTLAYHSTSSSPQTPTLKSRLPNKKLHSVPDQTPKCVKLVITVGAVGKSCSNNL